MRVSTAICKQSSPILPTLYLKFIAYPAESAPVFLAALLNNRVNQAKTLGLLAVHEIIAVGIILDLIHGATGMSDHGLIQPFTHTQYLSCMDVKICRLALKTTHGLMHHHAGMRQRESLPLGATGENKSSHARCLTDTHGTDIRLDELHGVVNGQPRIHRTTRRVDIK